MSQRIGLKGSKNLMYGAYGFIQMTYALLKENFESYKVASDHTHDAGMRSSIALRYLDRPSKHGTL